MAKISAIMNTQKPIPALLSDSDPIAITTTMAAIMLIQPVMITPFALPGLAIATNDNNKAMIAKANDTTTISTRYPPSKYSVMYLIYLNIRYMLLLH